MALQAAHLAVVLRCLDEADNAHLRTSVPASVVSHLHVNALRRLCRDRNPDAVQDHRMQVLEGEKTRAAEPWRKLSSIVAIRKEKSLRWAVKRASGAWPAPLAARARRRAASAGE